MQVSFSFAGGVLVVMLNNVPHTLSTSHPNFARVKGMLNEGTEEEILEVLNGNVESRVPEKIIEGTKMKFDGETLTYDGVEVEHVIVERLRQFAADDMPIQHLCNMLEKLLHNESPSAREELYKFLEHENLPIMPDGDFLAWKAVKGNYTDKHSGTIDCSIGNTIKMKREDVDDNRDTGCGKGLHCGAMSYAEGFGGYGDRMVLVKVNPKDVVCVPTDCSWKKVRCCRYVMYQEYKPNGSQDMNAVAVDDDLRSASKFQRDESDWSIVNDLDERSAMVSNPAPDSDMPLKWAGGVSPLSSENSGACPDDDNVTSSDVEVERTVSNVPFEESPELFSMPNVKRFIEDKMTDDYGVKPSGQKFYNVKDETTGRFTKK